MRMKWRGAERRKRSVEKKGEGEDGEGKEGGMTSDSLFCEPILMHTYLFHLCGPLIRLHKCLVVQLPPEKNVTPVAKVI